MAGLGNQEFAYIKIHITMGSSNAARAPAVALTPGSLPKRDWVDFTIRLATSWVGLFTAYTAALLLALTQYTKLKLSLQGMGLPLWVAIALIAAFPVLALVLSTIPTIIDQRRIRLYSQLGGSLQPGYFTLRPRETEQGFERADNAHIDILSWIEASTAQVLYLTGASGTGKSSLLAAWVLPKLKQAGHTILRLRGYEDLPARSEEEILKPGAVWDRASRGAGDLKSLLARAHARLAPRRLFIVVDQFEEFLILKSDEQQQSFRQFLTALEADPVDGLTVLLVLRPEYQGVLDSQGWPKRLLGANLREVFCFSESAAREFMNKSGLNVDDSLLRAVLREAAEIEQGTLGLIRPVTLNLCGLVLGRFASSLPSRFRGGLIRGFLRESISLPETRETANRIIPQLITANVTKRPRTIAELAQSTALESSAVRACLRRLGERDRAIVRPLDQHQETWEISHDFLVPLLDAIVARRTVSLWRRFRPWLPWATTAIMAITAALIPLILRQDPSLTLGKQGWVISHDDRGILVLGLSVNLIPPQSISLLRSLPPPWKLQLDHPYLTDISALRALRNLTELDISNTSVTDVSPLRELKNLTWLDLSGTEVTDVSALPELKNLMTLGLSNTSVTDVSPLRELKNLTWLDLTGTKVTDVSPLRELKNLTHLDLGATEVTDVSPLRELKNLTHLDLTRTKVTDVSPLRELKLAIIR
jgi:hypothetical protein